MFLIKKSDSQTISGHIRVFCIAQMPSQRKSHKTTLFMTLYDSQRSGKATVNEDLLIKVLNFLDKVIHSG